MEWECRQKLKQNSKKKRFDNYLEVINKDYKDVGIEIAEWSKD